MGTFVSMSGLDLSFLREAPVKKKRGRPRKAKPAKQYPDCRADFGFPRVMSDIKPFVSPIDGTEISSRSGLAAHERRYGVKQCGDYKPGQSLAVEEKRVAETLRDAEMESVTWE